MTEVEQLNERITQLSELIKAERESIQSMEISLKAAEEARDRLKEHWKETEPTFKRCRVRETYYTIEFNNYHGFMVVGERDVDLPTDKGAYDNNNYFKTEKRAQEVADKLNFLLKLERLHDTYCPDYTPDWENNNELKYSVFYDNYSRLYRISMFSVNDYKNNAFFATQEIAQKVRDILNAELMGEKSNDY